MIINFIHSLDEVGNGVGCLVEHLLYVSQLKEDHCFDRDEGVVLGTCLPRRHMTN